MLRGGVAVLHRQAVEDPQLQGEDVLFSYIIIVGYLFGIANKVVNDDINYVLAFYILDLCLVLIDTAIYYRNTMCQHDDSATADD